MCVLPFESVFLRLGVPWRLRVLPVDRRASPDPWVVGQSPRCALAFFPGGRWTSIGSYGPNGVPVVRAWVGIRIGSPESMSTTEA